MRDKLDMKLEEFSKNQSLMLRISKLSHEEVKVRKEKKERIQMFKDRI